MKRINRLLAVALFVVSAMSSQAQQQAESILDIENYQKEVVSAHNLPPFIRKYPEPGREALVLARENFMLPGIFYDIEIGRIGNSLWLSVDGRKVIETEDESILSGGHLAFRIRGTAGFKAACLIRDVEIYSEK